jgi:TRAP-type C4-dicarboxylate transport system substrate-binding protein
MIGGAASYKRKKKKIIAITIVMLMLLTLLVACGNNAPAPPPAPPTENGTDVGLGPPVNFGVGHPFPTTDYRGMAVQYFADLVAELSDGNMTVDVFPSSQVVTSQDALRAVSAGTIDMAVGALSFNVASVPALIGLDIHGIYDPEYFWETYDVIRPVLERIMNEENQTLLIVFDETETIFYLNPANARDVTHPSDLAGLRLRDHGMWIGRSIESWGASPMTVVPADVAVALERGTVDGGYTGWGFVRANRLHESAPHITFSGIGKSTWSPLNMNLDVYNSLTQAQRDIIREAAERAQNESLRLLDGLEEIFVSEVLEFGGTVHRMTTEQTQVFVDAAMTLLDDARAEAGPLGNELIDALLSAPSRFR